MKRLLITILFGIVLLLGFVVFAILLPAGSFKDIEPHFTGTTEKTELPIVGPEDIEIDRVEGLVFISADDRRSNIKNPGSVAGGIFTYRIEEGTESLKNITPSTLTDFHPHGISLFRANDSTLFVFAVSHQTSGRQVIERFEWKHDTLIHLESIEDHSMTSPNDLVAVAERKFYVTNDHYYTSGTSRLLEEYLQRAISYVNYFDGTSFRTVAEGIGYANGINESPDGKYILVAGSSSRTIYVFEKSEDGSLIEVDRIALGTGPDNIDFDEHGNILVACHPQLLKFVAHAKDPKNYSPSQVLKITYTNPGVYSIEEIFLNDGSNYSGSSIAVTYENTLLIGSVFEPALLLCKYQ